MDKLEQHLNCSLSMPSTTHTYSVITEFIRKWFLSRFGDYFKHVHIEGKHVFDDFRFLNISDILKKERPILAIIPKITLEYNRDMLDTNQFGIDTMIKTGRLDRAIIRDFNRNTYIGTTLELLEIKYSFIMKLETRAQQIDLYKYICMVFSIGHSSVENIDLDYHIPYTLMLQLAHDAGYEVKDNNIIDVIGFVTYVNSISRLPIIFKYRTINGRMEFFMRFHDIDIMIDHSVPLSFDDGERRGMLQKNFTVEMDITVKTASPKFFLYYSSNEHDIIQNISTSTIDPTSKPNDIIYPIYSIKIEKVPKVNEKGWNQYIATEYYDDKNKDNLEIDFKGLFQEGVNMYRVIKESNDMGISPSNFIDFKIYNGSKYLIPYEMDWDKIIMKLKEPVESHNTYISIYVDTDYIFEKVSELDKLKNTRLK